MIGITQGTFAAATFQRAEQKAMFIKMSKSD